MPLLGQSISSYGFERIGLTHRETNRLREYRNAQSFPTPAAGGAVGAADIEYSYGARSTV